MNVLIAYASKTGTTAECAVLLQKELHGAEVTLADLSESTPDPADFDAVIVGSYVRFGKTDKRVSAFLRQNEAILSEKYLGLFLCCGEIQNMEDYVKKLIPAGILAHAFDVDCFGGQLDPRKCRGVERLIVKFLRSLILNSTEHDEGQYEKTLPALLPENISRMATALRTAVLTDREKEQ